MNVVSSGRQRISVVIPTWNGLHFLEPCCRSLWETTESGEIEIVVVDNGSTDGTVEWLASRQTEGRLVALFNAENLGFAKATNQGIRRSDGDILLLNNDIVALPGWLAPLRQALERDDRVAAAGSLLLYPGRRLVQHAGVNIGRIDGKMKVYHPWQRRLVDAVPQARVTREMKAVTAACMLLRRSALDDVGLLDETFVNGYEDVDLCLRLHERGWKLVYRGDSVLEHHESVTKGRHDKEVENRALFFGRWQDRVKPDAVDMDCRAEMQENDRRRRFLLDPTEAWNIRRMASLLARRGASEEAQLWKRLSGFRIGWWFLRPSPEIRRRIVEALGYPEVADRV